MSSTWIRNLNRRRRIAVGAGLAAAVAVPLALTGAGPASATAYTVRASVSSGGAQAGGSSADVSISADGRYVAFSSDATDLVRGDTNAQSDVFVHDLRTGSTRRVSVGAHGVQANGGSFRPSLSADGRYVAFESGAANLVAGDTNHVEDVFVRDLRTGITRRASVTSRGHQADGGGAYFAALSADGRHVAFESGADDLVPGDTNRMEDVFMHDLRTGVTQRVSVGAHGTQARGGDSEEATISAHGRYVAFTSYAANLVRGDTNGTSDVFRRDLRTGITIRVSVGTGGGPADGGDHGLGSEMPSMSSDGTVVAFQSVAANLTGVPPVNPEDIYARNLVTGVTQQVSVGAGGVQGDLEGGYYPQISPDGRYVAFESIADNFVTGDTNAAEDTFVRDLRRQVTSRPRWVPPGRATAPASTRPSAPGRATSRSSPTPTTW